MRTFPQQKAALTRALRTENPDVIRREVERTYGEWESDEWRHTYRHSWPDDWNRWRVALNDALGWHAWHELTGQY